MPENNEIYLSDALVYNSFKLGKFNFIQADCGSGKTTAAFTTIPQYLHVTGARSLILINTTSGADSFVNEGFAQHYTPLAGKEWSAIFKPELEKPIVMTYAMFGAQIKKETIKLEDYDYIVCDEIHTLNQYIGMARGQLRKQYPQAETWEINDMLAVTCFTYIALEAIEAAITGSQIWVFGLTATPDQIYKYDLQRLGQIINEVQLSQKVHAYQTLSRFEYADIEPILRAHVENNRKRLFFFHSIKELNKHLDTLRSYGRAAEALWSTHDLNHPLTHQQLTTRDFILQEQKFPPEIQDLLINGAYETAINIRDPLVQEVYVHSGNKDTQIQARNRLRQNIEVLGVYNHDANKADIMQQKLNDKVDRYIENFPPSYLNVELAAQDKEKLIKELNFPKKWTSLKKALIRQGYEVEDKNNGAYRYSIIRKPI